MGSVVESFKGGLRQQVLSPEITNLLCRTPGRDQHTQYSARGTRSRIEKIKKKLLVL